MKPIMVHISMYVHTLALLVGKPVQVDIVMEVPIRLLSKLHRMQMRTITGLTPANSPVVVALASMIPMAL